MGRHIARIVSGIARQIKQMVRTDAQFFAFESHAYINCRRHVFKINHLIIQQVQIICQEHTMGRHGPTDKKDGAHNSKIMRDMCVLLYVGSALIPHPPPQLPDHQLPIPPKPHKEN